jgi:hypothetical protein
MRKHEQANPFQPPDIQPAAYGSRRIRSSFIRQPEACPHVIFLSDYDMHLIEHKERHHETKQSEAN